MPGQDLSPSFPFWIGHWISLPVSDELDLEFQAPNSQATGLQNIMTQNAILHLEPACAVQFLDLIFVFYTKYTIMKELSRLKQERGAAAAPNKSSVSQKQKLSWDYVW